jgi:triosephosphate isomerase
VILGVSLKMYFDTARTVAWCRELAQAVAGHPALSAGAAELFVLPTFPAVPGALEALAGSGIRVGAQDLFWRDAGAFTGEVSGRDLAELGCRYVELGHAERRRIFHEDAAETGLKLAAAVRNGLTPVLCTGEGERGGAADAAQECIDTLARIFDGSGVDDGERLIVAYEPEWAIGSTEPADGSRVAEVLGRVRAWLDAHAPFRRVDVIYGGSAGPGTLTALSGSVDGLFLGRFAHDVQALAGILDESLRRVEGEPLDGIAAAHD